VPEGEIAGISYRVQGVGPPLVLLPLELSPRQWGPLIPALAAHWTTITLGGAHLGSVASLEERGRSGYIERRIRRRDQGRAVGDENASRNRKFESTPLQQTVRLSRSWPAEVENPGVSRGCAGHGRRRSRQRRA
jgi:hypothetical protein